MAIPQKMFIFIYLTLHSMVMTWSAPIAKNMVDMTYVFDDTTLHYYKMRGFGAKVLHNGMTDGGYWLRFEEYSSAIHVGTHMDAPSHFIKDGMPVDKISITNFIAPAAVIDITAKAKLDRDAEITVEDLIKWEATTSLSLNGTFVLMRSGWSQKWNNAADFMGYPAGDPGQLHSPGMSPEAAQWLVDNREIIGVGMDTMSFDKGSSQNYETHQILLGHGLFGVENLANMEKIPISGATLYVFPMKIGNASGAPTRVIATFSDDVSDFLTSDKDEL